MTDIRFIAGKDDGKPWTDPDFPLLKLVYLQISVNDDEGSTLSGWVMRDVRRLVHAAPDNQAKLYAHERLIGRLYEALKSENFDDAMDLVKAEYDSIHGPSQP